MPTKAAHATYAVTPNFLSLRDALRAVDEPIARFDMGELRVEIRAVHDSVFALIRRPGAGGLAIRAAYLNASFSCKSVRAKSGEAARIAVTSGMGEHEIMFVNSREALERLRITVRLTPATDLILPFAPRDIYPLGTDDDPLRAAGTIEASQRGLNAGILYFRIDEPAFGNVLYLQNLTALNDYFRATGAKPKEVVGGEWPELGYLLPTPEADACPADVSLKQGEPVTLSDVILVFRHEAPPHERESARQFVQMLGSAYKMLDLPPVQFRDWADRAERAAGDLAEAPEATIRHYGNLYVHPYTAAEYPDIMVQMSVITALHDWGKWRGEPHPLEAKLKKGLRKFYDPKLKTLRRYLPNVGKDKNADAVDSWYLYHPLLNLGILALDGDEDARALFLDSLDFAIRAAQQFDYRWPVQYDITDFSLIEETAPADGRGQTDVGGIYAWVMLQAFELTDDKRFLDEAKAAIEAAIGLRFNINYQANLTAWGAAACMRLWRITNRDVYLEQSYVYLASFLHNAVIWDSQIGHAAHYETFLAVTCLQDAPYMAMYECFDSFAAFERYLDDGGPDLEPEARMLVSEYCKYALSRAWFYYPDALPPEAISQKQRETNGHIDSELSFPLEDLYPDGQPAGQVGQEVYGAGAAFIFASRAFHHVEGAPFRVYCDYLVRGIERTGDRALTITLHGGEACTANLRLVRLKRRKLTKSTVTTAEGDMVRPHETSDDRIDYHVPADGRVIVSWE
ncbi:hypothetical protein FHS96_005630 [Sphingomonas zeicaulis]|uniref:hypothetical protein n=1 Tax=Sphingomonas zeicaulis TaxID=1632740 RepID=UPI003D1C5552